MIHFSLLSHPSFNFGSTIYLFFSFGTIIYPSLDFGTISDDHLLFIRVVIEKLLTNCTSRGHTDRIYTSGIWSALVPKTNTISLSRFFSLIQNNNFQYLVVKRQKKTYTKENESILDSFILEMKSWKTARITESTWFKNAQKMDILGSFVEIEKIATD